MGCGPSTIINPRKWRSRARSNTSGSDAGSDEEDEAGPATAAAARAADSADGEDAAALLADGGHGSGCAGSGAAALLAADADDEASRAAAARLRLLAQNAPGPLLSPNYVPHIEVSMSQQDFFRILDMKVESGPELDPEDENERLLEEARLGALLLEWQRCSRRGPTTTPLRAANPPTQGPPGRHPLDALSQQQRAKADQELAGLAGHPGLGLGGPPRAGLGGGPRHAAQPYAPASAGPQPPHEAWRRTNLAWVPEQRPVGGLGTAYPGRAVPASAGTWSHLAFTTAFDGVQASPWYPTSAASSATSSAISTVAPQSGFRPYRADAAGQPGQASQTGQWTDVGQLGQHYDDGTLYYGHGLVGLGGLGHGAGQSMPADAYYAPHYGLGLRYGHAAAGLGPGPGPPSRHPDQHLANSMVQLDKSGGTRTELA